MNPKDYLMDEIWPLLDDEQKRRLVFITEMMNLYPSPESDKVTG